MVENSDDLINQKESLQKSIRALEALPGHEATIAFLEEQLAIVNRQIEMGGGIYIEGNIATQGGDFISGNKVVHIYEGSYNGEVPQTEVEIIHIYRQVLANRCGSLPLRRLDTRTSDPSIRQEALNLSTVYISLDTTLRLEKESDEDALETENQDKTNVLVNWHHLLEHAGGSKKEVQRVAAGLREAEFLPALEACVLCPRLVLTGDPGSGKSTFVNYLAQSLALQNWDTLPTWPENARDIIPVLVVLRDFVFWLETLPDEKRRPTPKLLWDYIAYDCQERNLGFILPYLTGRRDKDGLLMLLDGLDEVPTGTSRTLVREMVEKFAQRHRGIRLLVTCRVLSYQKPEWQLTKDRFPVFELAPFSNEKIQNFIRAWHQEVAAKWNILPHQLKIQEQKLSQAVRRPDLQRLARNPLLLTVMALVHTEYGELPDERTKLYESAVDVLLWKWEQEKTSEQGQIPYLLTLLREAGRDRNDLRIRLAELAFDAHQQVKESDENRESVTGIPVFQLLNTLRKMHPTGSLDWAEKLVETMKLRAGLLLEKDSGMFTFPHRTFQEYLAGVHLARQKNFARQACALVDAGGFWQEAILLGVGYLVHSIQNFEKPLLLVDELCTEQPHPLEDETAWRRVWLAGEVLLELGVNRAQDTRSGTRLLTRVRHLLTHLVGSGILPARERAQAGNVLARLGDPRFDPQSFYLPVYFRGNPEPLYGLIQIPAGRFVMGSHPGDDMSRKEEYGNPAQLEIPYDYWMARYPTTVAQYTAFIEADGYQQQRWWTGPGWTWLQKQETRVPHRWTQQLSHPSHPVVNITWHEAMAYAHWLNNKLQPKLVEKIPAGWVIRLPTEAEWEKAARGGDARYFPWGNEITPDHVNCWDTLLGGTSPVGMFPRGEAENGLLDLSGNVWEWTGTLYKPYPYKPGDGRNDPEKVGERALRGGAWDDDDRDVRCASRDGNSPDDSDDDIGFRMVVSQPGPGF